MMRPRKSAAETRLALVCKSREVTELEERVQSLERELTVTKRENAALRKGLQSENAQGLVTKSLQVAELTENVDKLLQDLSSASRENVALREENQKQYDMLQELSRIVRAGAKPTSSTDALEISAQSGEIITAGDAMDLTISNLRQQVEGLEDERLMFIKQIVSLEAKLEEMQKVDEAREIKITCLENVYEMNNEVDKANSHRPSLNTVSITSTSDSSISSKDCQERDNEFEPRGIAIVDSVPTTTAAAGTMDGRSGTASTPRRRIMRFV